jgi:hypothetical protein
MKNIAPRTESDARSSPQDGRIERSWLAMTTGIVAVAAFAGAVGLATGSLDPGPVVTARLPWHSGALAGLALAVVVALPMTVAALLAARDRPGHGRAAVIAGALLAGWIVVEIAVIREFSWLQAVFALAAVVVMVVGRHRVARRRRSRSHADR